MPSLAMAGDRRWELGDGGSAFARKLGSVVRHDCGLQNCIIRRFLRKKMKFFLTVCLGGGYGMYINP